MKNLGLASYLARRLLLLVPVLLGTTFVTFFIARVAVPDPARAWAGIKASSSTLAAITARYHLNAPIYVQYYYYMVGLVTGDWGISPTTGRPVLSDIEFFFPATIELALVAFLITMVLGILLGVIAASYYNTKVDHSIKVLYLTGYSSPPFFVAIALLFLLGFVFRVFPTEGELSSSLSPPSHITGMYIIDSLLTGNWVDFKDSLWHIILPAFALALTYFGIITRVTRTSMYEVLQRDFIRGAYAKGLTRWTVIWKQALRNALIPTTTVLGLLLGSLLAGTIVIETIFSWPGIGYYATQAILNFDFPAVMGVTVLFTFSVVFANLLADILYTFLDPRIKV
jgi:ABC-type dipeptide/oligopeptide/nickel transport system permease component